MFNIGLDVDEVKKVVLFYKPSPEWLVSRESIVVKGRTVSFQPVVREAGPNKDDIQLYKNFIRDIFKQKGMLGSLAITTFVAEFCTLGDEIPVTNRSEFVRIEIL